MKHINIDDIVYFDGRKKLIGKVKEIDHCEIINSKVYILGKDCSCSPLYTRLATEKEKLVFNLFSDIDNNPLDVTAPVPYHIGSILYS